MGEYATLMGDNPSVTRRQLVYEQRGGARKPNYVRLESYETAGAIPHAGQQ